MARKGKREDNRAKPASSISCSRGLRRRLREVHFLTSRLLSLPGLPLHITYQAPSCTWTTRFPGRNKVSEKRRRFIQDEKARDVAGE